MGSQVAIRLGYGLDGLEFESPSGQEIYSFPKRPYRFLGLIQPPLPWITGFCPGGKVPGPEVNHSPPNAKAKNEWSYTSTPLICLCGVDGDNFTFNGCETWYLL